MKRIIQLVVLFIVCMETFMFSACRDDLSSLDLNIIAGVEIDTTGQKELSVFQFDHLVLTPNLKTNLSEADLAYEWKINIAPGELEYTVIGTERDLDYEVTMIPTAANKFHQIMLTVTDTNTGLQYVMGWPLTIRNSIGQGLVIAETPDGVNTDISHIMSSRVTADYSGESIKRHVFSSVNGDLLPGLTIQLLYTRRRSDPVLLGITDHSLYAIKTLDYSFYANAEQLFYIKPDVIKPQFLTGFKQGFTELAFLVNDGKLHGDVFSNNLFGRPLDFPYVLPEHVAINPEGNVMIHFYDEVHGKFIYLPSIHSFGDRNMHVQAQASAPFNPANLPNKKTLAAINNAQDQFVHVLKDKSTQEVGIYISTGGGYEYPNVLSPQAQAFYSLANAPEINNAKHFVLLDDQRVLYYATDTKIYAVLYGASTPTFSERYTIPSGEQITTLQVFQEPDYPTRDEADPPYLPTNNKQLILSTYNGSEGKVYLLPMINTGVGNIDIPNIKTYGGFDRITAIAPQL